MNFNLIVIIYRLRVCYLEQGYKMQISRRKLITQFYHFFHFKKYFILQTKLTYRCWKTYRLQYIKKKMIKRRRIVFGIEFLKLETVKLINFKNKEQKIILNFFKEFTIFDK